MGGPPHPCCCCCVHSGWAGLGHTSWVTSLHMIARDVKADGEGATGLCPPPFIWVEEGLEHLFVLQGVPENPASDKLPAPLGPSLSSPVTFFFFSGLKFYLFIF